jgi:hypothetical protein
MTIECSMGGQLALLANMGILTIRFDTSTGSIKIVTDLASIVI